MWKTPKASRSQNCHHLGTPLGPSSVWQFCVLCNTRPRESASTGEGNLFVNVIFDVRVDASHGRETARTLAPLVLQSNA